MWNAKPRPRMKCRSRFRAIEVWASALAGVLAVQSLFAQAGPERIPKTLTDAERMNDKVIARREYDSNARTLLNPKFREALDRYQPGAGPELTATWGEFMAVDGTPFIALQLAVPSALGLQSGDVLIFFGSVVELDGKQIATYNEPITIQTSNDDVFVERSLTIPLRKSNGTFGVARRGEILAMTRVTFEPEEIASAVAGVSRLIVSRDVHLLQTAQRPLDPFAFGGTKVVPKPGASFRKTDEVWIFAELRNPKMAEDGTPHIATKTTLDGPTRISGPPTPAVATPLKGMAGHYGVGNPIDVSKLKPGDYTLRVVITDMVTQQSFRRETAIHIRD